MIRLLIADDHEILREGLKYVVSHSPDISVVGEADNADSTLQLCRTTQADVLLLDVSMPGPGVLDTIKNVKAIEPSLRILVLSVHPEEQYARRVLAAGADGYLTKNHSSRELAAAVRQVHSGKKYLTASLAQELALDLVRGRNTQDLHETLSNREYQTLLQLGGGERRRRNRASAESEPQNGSNLSRAHYGEDEPEEHCRDHLLRSRPKTYH